MESSPELYTSMSAHHLHMNPMPKMIIISLVLQCPPMAPSQPNPVVRPFHGSPSSPKRCRSDRCWRSATRLSTRDTVSTKRIATAHPQLKNDMVVVQAIIRNMQGLEILRDARVSLLRKNRWALDSSVSSCRHVFDDWLASPRSINVVMR